MIRDVLEQLSGYPGLFALCAVSGILFPVPEDIALLYAGVRLQSGAFTWLPAATAACTGVLLRDTIVYWIGRKLGHLVLENQTISRVIGKEKLERARAIVERHGTASVLVGRGMLGMRSAVFLVAGASGIGFRKFVAVDALGILFTVPAVMLIGQWLGAPVIEYAFWMMRTSRWFVLALVFVALSWLTWTAINRGRGQEEA